MWASVVDLVQKCLSQCFSAEKRHTGQDNSYKGKHFIKASIQFIGLVHYSHGRELDSTKVGMETEIYIFTSIGRRKRGPQCAWFELLKFQSLSPCKYFI